MPPRRCQANSARRETDDKLGAGRKSSLPGCPLLISSQNVLATTTVGTSTQLSLAVPNVWQLFGVQLYLQAFSLRAGANPAQVVVSNGLQVIVSSL